MFEVDDKGIRISGSQLHLDARKKAPLSFVSHAHSDHVRRHHQIIATPETISLVRLRNSKINAISLPYHQRHKIGDVIIELIPSGHILGAAQIVVETNQARLIYTGDFKPGKSETTELLEVRTADILIMECTFGAPEFIFPGRWKIIERLVKFIDRCFKSGLVPVVMGYATGKAQEALKILGDLDYQVSIHPTVAPIVKVYEQHGVAFKNYQVYNGEDLRNRVLLIPPHLARGRVVNNIWQTRKLILTGWAMTPGAKYRYRADEALPLSDHADFEQLLDYVRRVQPRKVFITHGIESFRHHLRKAGFRAEWLEASPQMALF